MKQAYCSECGGYVALSEAGICPGGHGLPSYRDVREVDSGPATGAPRVSLDTAAPAPTGNVAKTRQPVFLAFAALGAGWLIATSLMNGHPGVALVTLLACAALFALALSRATFAANADTLLISQGRPWQRTLVWNDVVACRRDASFIRLDLRGGRAFDIDLRGLRRDCREPLVDALAGHLGARWPRSDDPALVAERRVQRRQIAILAPLVILSFVAVLASAYYYGGFRPGQ